MAGKKDSFYSSSGEHFWKDFDDRERSFIAETIKGDCKRGNSSFYFLIILMIFAFLYGIYHLITGSKELGSIYLFLMLVTPPLMLPMFISAHISNRRYLAKAAEGRFKSRHVRIVDRKITAKLTATYTVWLESTDGDIKDTATVDIERGLYEKMPVGMTGRFVRIDDEPVKLLVSPYWFISDTDPKTIAYAPSNPVSLNSQGQSFGQQAATVTPIIAAAPSSDEREKIKKAYRKTNGNRLAMAVLTALLFLIGGLYLIGGAITLYNSGDRSMSLIGIFTCIPAAVIVSIYFIRSVLTKKKLALLIWALWLNLNVFGLFAIVYPEFPLAARIAVIVGLLLINIGVLPLAHSDYIKAWKEICAGTYTIQPAMVRSINIVRRYIYPFFLISLCSCIIETESGQTYEIDIPNGQRKHLREDTEGKLLILDEDTSQRMFLDV
ncbi:MAG: hypothetical protein IJ757_07935 [Clostridiales bacterium]|nr:hypothetical protein [Clostridiales bacterium]